MQVAESVRDLRMRNLGLQPKNGFKLVRSLIISTGMNDVTNSVCAMRMKWAVNVGLYCD